MDALIRASHTAFINDFDDIIRVCDGSKQVAQTRGHKYSESSCRRRKQHATLLGEAINKCRYRILLL